MEQFLLTLHPKDASYEIKQLEATLNLKLKLEIEVELIENLTVSYNYTEDINSSRC